MFTVRNDPLSCASTSAPCEDEKGVTFKQYLLNTLVLLEVDKVKCCCCNITIHNDGNQIIEHLKCKMHSERIKRFSNIDFDLSEDECQNFFNNYIAISLNSFSDLMHNRVNRFISLCYYCQQVIHDGYNGIKQHMKHKEKSVHRKDYCSICLVHVQQLKAHQLNKFHIQIMMDCANYGISLEAITNQNNDNDKRKLSIPMKFKNKYEYKEIFKNIIDEEQAAQKALLKTFKMTDLTVCWEGERGINHQPKAFFKPNPVDENYFKLKLGDEVVISLQKYVNWTMSARVIQLPSSQSDEVCIQMTNGTGLPKNIPEPYKIVPKWQNTVFWRMKLALTKLIHFSNVSYILDVLLNDVKDKDYKKPVITFNANDIKVFPNSKPLNELQRNSIKIAMEEQVTIIQGPPGTGKTETCISIIYNMLRQVNSIKILVCAPSNAAVDILAQKLDELKIKIVRFFCHRYQNIDSPVKHLGLLEQMLRQNENLQKNYSRFIENQMDTMEKATFSEELAMAEEKVWESVQVTCCTCLSAGAENVKDRMYNVVIIDEAAQATVPECLVPIVMDGVTKVILIGDHKQLGPVVISKNAEEAGLGISLFQRLIQQKSTSKIMLNTQYRMHPKISHFPSKMFYDGKLKNSNEESDQMLKFDWLGEKDDVVIFFHINGLEERIGTSYHNNKEPHCVLEFLDNLITHDIVEPEQVGIITPYEQQSRLLRTMFTSSELIRSELIKEQLQKVEVANVDGFQGKEKAVIILSFVRSHLESHSNQHKSIGFLKDPRRLNVALTRAKRKLILFGNMQTLKNNKMYADLLSFIRAEGSIINK